MKLSLFIRVYGLTIGMLLTCTAMSWDAIGAESCSPGAPGAPQLEPLPMVAARKTLDLLPLYLGVAKGFFRQQGLEVTISVTGDERSAIDQLRTGKSAYYIGPASSGVVASVRGGGIKAISFPYDTSGIRFLSGVRIESPKQLKGKKLGIDYKGSPVHFWTKSYLMTVGVDPDLDVKFIQAAYEETTTDMLANGKVDLVAIDPASRWEGLSKQFNVFPIGTGLIPSPLTAIFVSDSELATNRHRVQKTLRAMSASIWYTLENPKEAKRILAREWDIPSTSVAEVYETVKLGLRATGWASPRSLQVLGKMASFESRTSPTVYQRSFAELETVISILEQPPLIASLELDPPRRASPTWRFAYRVSRKASNGSVRILTRQADEMWADRDESEKIPGQTYMFFWDGIDRRNTKPAPAGWYVAKIAVSYVSGFEEFDEIDFCIERE